MQWFELFIGSPPKSLEVRARDLQDEECVNPCPLENALGGVELCTQLSVCFPDRDLGTSITYNNVFCTDMLEFHDLKLPSQLLAFPGSHLRT